MIKDFEEYKKYRSRSHSDITPEENKEIRKAMSVFEDNNPEIFEELQIKKWATL